MNELVSVIIPVYQCSRYVEECVLSIQKQAYQHIEIVLVDDGSTDGSSELCDKLANIYKNIVIYHQENMGVSVARNRGIELAHGEYIIFVDSDDYIESNIIGLAMQNYEKYQMDLCVFGFQKVSEKTFRKFDFRVPFESDRLLSRDKFGIYMMDLFSQNVLHAIGTKIYKKSIIDRAKIRFQTAWEYCEDIYFCLSYIGECENILFMNKVGYYYRIGNEGSLSNKVIKNGNEGVFETFYLLKKYIENINWNEEIKERFFRAYEYCVSNLQGRESDQVALTDKYKNMFLTMNHWMNNYLNGVSIAHDLKEYGYKKVAIYGMNSMGITLLMELENTEIEVAYAIDRNADRLHSTVDLYKPDDELPETDVIIVTAISAYEEIKKNLCEKGFSQIISLENLIYK